MLKSMINLALLGKKIHYFYCTVPHARDAVSTQRKWIPLPVNASINRYFMCRYENNL